MTTATRDRLVGLPSGLTALVEAECSRLHAAPLFRRVWQSLPQADRAVIVAAKRERLGPFLIVTQGLPQWRNGNTTVYGSFVPMMFAIFLNDLQLRLLPPRFRLILLAHELAHATRFARGSHSEEESEEEAGADALALSWGFDVAELRERTPVRG